MERWKAVKVLITGGAGFLGYHLAHHFAARGWSVGLLDVAPFNPSEYPSGAQFYMCDVRDKSTLDTVVRSFHPDAIIHAAAALPLSSRTGIFTTNVDGTRNVIEAGRRYGVGRVVYVSSTAVYGIPRKHPIEETDRLQGVGPYGESKILAERACEEFRKLGYTVPVIRPKTFIGPARLGVFAILYDWVYSGARIPILGRGTNRYQLLDVRDLCQAVELLTVWDATAVNNTFNVGAERFSTVREDLGGLCEAARTGARPLPIPALPAQMTLALLEKMLLSPLYKWVYLTADKDSFVSVVRLKEATGWSAQFSNQDALIDSYRWYVAHQDECAEAGMGVTHRVAWDQKVLGALKAVLSLGTRADAHKGLAS